MSLQGKYTPLSINVVCGLLKNQGFNINSKVVLGAGTSTSLSNYTKGGFAQSNLLSDAIRTAWTQLGTNVNTTTYNKLISIGSSSVPALGNSAPTNFTASYSPLFIERWTSQPDQRTYSLSVTTPSVTFSGIPSTATRSPWSVKVNGTTLAANTYTVSNNTLVLNTAPAKNSKVELFSDEGTSYGFLRVLALQASKEFYFNRGVYPDFVASFNQANSTLKQVNHTVNSVTNAIGYLEGTYSNMNDLITSDIAGVSLATLQFGQDLINLGRAITLSRISTFGSPHGLLLTLQANNAITEELNLAMLAAGIEADELLDLYTSNYNPSIEQEKKLYNAYRLLSGSDLSGILILLNVQTSGITTLADLLSVEKLFPKSKTTLTTPFYNLSNQISSSKIYHFIYTGTGANTVLKSNGYGQDLKLFLPDNDAVACDAFRKSMVQVKNITGMDIEKFAQVVANLETVSDLPNINGTTTPNDTTMLRQTAAQIALGSGKDGMYLLNDFFGSMSGIPYNLVRINALVTQLQTTALVNIYKQINDELAITRVHDSYLDTLITQANTEITNIRTRNPELATELNTLWNQLGKQLSIEIAARSKYLIPNDSANETDLFSFSESIELFAEDTQYGMAAATLDKISDNTITGRSIIGAMREARNAKRLGLSGGVLDNDVPDDKSSESAGAISSPPKVTGAASTPGSFAGSPETSLMPPKLDIYSISSDIQIPITTVEQARQEVIDCNCDCWDDIENL